MKYSNLCTLHEVLIDQADWDHCSNFVGSSRFLLRRLESSQQKPMDSDQQQKHGVASLLGSDAHTTYFRKAFPDWRMTTEQTQPATPLQLLAKDLHPPMTTGRSGWNTSNSGTGYVIQRKYHYEICQLHLEGPIKRDIKKN